MLSITRFQEDGDFPGLIEPLVRLWRAEPGNHSVEVVRNLDEPQLWAVVSRWADVGSYRRALSRNKLELTPILLRALDEPSAYLDPAELGENLPRET